eukprot:CAMPEP_0180676910 /NCGR_PEP_ID=MMETSP1037_2-20121125/67572_1 /TAXON_ID=632150 /ORGANISM="Azadinium spinosum, Strain 3D9" /LENGTH=59 /DNA_ID=CAMNT_0022706461 /DNA_START=374 /DNA_END=550 /DNA_ORIENTATION=+
MRYWYANASTGHPITCSSAMLRWLTFLEWQNARASANCLKQSMPSSMSNREEGLLDNIW